MQHYAAADGTRLAYQRHGTGPLVVLCHAGFVDCREWDGLVPLLADDHTVVTPDRRGHGASDPYRDDHRLDHDIDDLRRLVELVTEPTERALLVAHSAACYVALGTALESRRIAGLILFEPPTFGQPAISQELWGRLDRARETGDRAQLVALLLNEVVGPATGQVLPPPALEGMLASPFGQWLLDNALSIPTELRGYEAYRWDDDVLRRLAVPTLLLVGEHSPVFNRRFADRLSALAAEATVQVLAGQDHGAPFRAPGVVAAAIREFSRPSR